MSILPCAVEPFRCRYHNKAPREEPSQSPKIGTIFSRISKRSPESALSTTPPFKLVSLPTELLQHIASYLPASSFASLAVTSSYFYRTLGTLPWLHLKDKNIDPEFFRLVELLQKDDPRYFFCPRCALLHQTTIPPSLSLTFPLAPKEHQIAYTTSHWKFSTVPLYTLTNAHIALAKARDSNRATGICIDSLVCSGYSVFSVYPQLMHPRKSRDEKFTYRYRFAPLIASSGEFILHAYHAVNLGTDVRLPCHKISMVISRAIADLGIKLCKHELPRHAKEILLKELNHKVLHANSRHWGGCGKECKRLGVKFNCGCDVCYEIRRVKKNNIEICFEILTWVVLGEEGAGARAGAGTERRTVREAYEEVDA
ncbi:hypothetical protein K432DRAFT_407631 [Lepidopterella palustris CBS 459.81]|uniref:F-box domain-containing protein n=1 Tax=Lepidopterella palustris CBS 459.81 TaxID=1314670 RepID=A0A8E2E4H0_9PEZI|nr:hypothetical protein K432DRAFT_407631 [Lepidopterella palustris CBS 459.81]